ncbi:MAG: hypothetical protein WCG87_11860 [Bacteroidota bacterium]
MKYFLTFLYLLLMPYSLFSQTKIIERKLNRYDLEHKIFDEQLFTDNFVKVDEKYYYPNNDNILHRVAGYNSIMKNIDTNYIVKVKFSFKDSKHIEKITFTILNRDIDIIKFTESSFKNGLAIRVMSGEYIYNKNSVYHFQLLAGLFYGGKPYGCHLSYNPRNDSICLIQTYYDSTGKIIKETKSNNCKWRS